MKPLIIPAPELVSIDELDQEIVGLCARIHELPCVLMRVDPDRYVDIHTPNSCHVKTHTSIRRMLC